MKIFIIALCSVLIMGCASVGTRQKWKLEVLDKEGKIEEKAKWENVERYICRGAGCKVDFKNETMEGGTLIPDIPVKLNN